MEVPDRRPLEGRVLDAQPDGVQGICRDVVEVYTEYDWDEVPWSVRIGFELWWEAFSQWMEEQR